MAWLLLVHPDSSKVPNRVPLPSESQRSRARVLLPPAVVLMLAVFWSITVHLPVYGVLGALADHFAAMDVDLPPAAPVEVTLAYEPATAPTPSPPTESPSELAPTPSSTPTDRARPTVDRPEDETREDEAEVTMPPRPEPVPEEEEEEEPEPEEEAEAVEEPPTPEELAHLRAVVQHVEEDEAEAPDDARFMAEENHTAEEETVAETTTTVTNDADPTELPSEIETGEAEGGDTEDLVAEARDVEGSDLRHVTVEESRERPADTDEPPSTSVAPSAEGGATDAEGSDSTSERGTPTRSDEGGAAASDGGEEIPTVELLVSDGMGSFRIRVPDRSRLRGGGGGSEGGARAEGAGAGASGEGGGRVAGDDGGGEDRRGERGGVRVGLSWSDFESVYGEEELRHEREARLEERRSRRRGAGRERMWAAFRAAMENYVPEVRTGNQTELGTARVPFATFLHDVHVRIHQEFSDGYVTRIAMDTTTGENDPSLHTTLEVSINADGSLNQIGIVRTSGNTLFDQGAFNAMWRAQPFPRPPDEILSGDGRAWLRWNFHRDDRRCATDFAEPFILDNAPVPARDDLLPAGDDDEPMELPEESEPGEIPIEMAPAAGTIRGD